MSEDTRWIDRALLDAVSARARDSARGRMNLNFHPHDAHPAHRLLNAIEPDSYVRPHRHLDASKDETILCLRGRLGCILFADDGAVQDCCVLQPDGERIGVDIAHGQFHSLVALEAGSVMFEAKAGPYRPLETAEFAPWAPADGEAAERWLAWMKGLFASAG
ncbi:WbuC family cupin fold metalloprotein [Methyloversatilis thermotolerans]|uniref:WbuC family cupin fold metalloprotein n=1 Tax=Methyloversatilis thermotolerans TaxID=1346290 RepID=UPI0003791E15|nr:WbuC family cupin fold metalloprotein [Methyloversatilis thermotolerans]